MFETREVQFRLDLDLKSKARPRFARGKAYMDTSYQVWQRCCRRLLKMIWDTNDLGVLDNCEIHVEAHGPGRADPDNLIGALLDAMQPHPKSGWEGVIKDDRVTVVPVISFRWIRDKNQFWDVTLRTRVEVSG